MTCQLKTRYIVVRCYGISNSWDVHRLHGRQLDSDKFQIGWPHAQRHIHTCLYTQLLYTRTARITFEGHLPGMTFMRCVHIEIGAAPLVCNECDARELQHATAGEQLTEWAGRG